MDDSLPARKRRKGGLRQRQASAKEAVSCPSELHELLMQCLAQGLLSAALVYNIGSAAQRDLQKTREDYLVTNLEQISNLKFGRNFTRSLESHLHSLADVPEPLSIKMGCLQIRTPPWFCCRASSGLGSINLAGCWGSGNLLKQL